MTKKKNPGLLMPDHVFSRITAIPPQYLREQGITALVLDIDNTLTTHDNPELPADVAAWLAARKAEGFQFAVASNNHEPRVAPFAQKIGVKWVSDAGKPLPRGFARAQAQFGVPKAQMALIGDQLFTDVLGARLFGIKALLVEPMAPDHKWYIRLKRVLEKPFVTLYYKRGGQRSGE